MKEGPPKMSEEVEFEHIPVVKAGHNHRPRLLEAAKSLHREHVVQVSTDKDVPDQLHLKN